MRNGRLAADVRRRFSAQPYRTHFIGPDVGWARGRDTGGKGTRERETGTRNRIEFTIMTSMESRTDLETDKEGQVSYGRPEVVTDFASGYVPPFNVSATVEKLLDAVPARFLNGLSEIVLTNATGLPRKLRRGVTKSRKKKVRTAEARGLYYQQWNGRPAWIKIYVDNTLRGWERGPWLRLNFFREMLLSDVLFHEIGHHIHKTVRREFREREDVADDWRIRLRRQQFASQHPIQWALLSAFKPLLNRVGTWLTGRGLRQH